MRLGRFNSVRRPVLGKTLLCSVQNHGTTGTKATRALHRQAGRQPFTAQYQPALCAAGYSLGVLNSALSHIAYEFDLQSSGTSLIMTILVLGATGGAFIAGPVRAMAVQLTMSAQEHPQQRHALFPLAKVARTNAMLCLAYRSQIALDCGPRR